MALADTQFESTNNNFKKNLPLIIKIIAGILVACAVIAGVFYAVNVLAPEDSVDGDKWIPDYTVVTGNEDSNVVMIEFFDLQCPACRDNKPKFKNIAEKYSDRAAFAYRHLPLNSIHPFAQEAGQGAQAAARQDDQKFLDYLDEVYAIQNDISSDGIEQAARNAGLDVDQWRRDKNSSFTKNEVKADEEFILAADLPPSDANNNSTRATGTPTIVIVKDDEPVSGWSGSQDESFQEQELLKYLDDVEESDSN